VSGMPRKSKQQKQRPVCDPQEQAKCRGCSKQIAGGFAYFSFGAVIDLVVQQKHKLSDEKMEAFCDIGYHGIDSSVTDSANYCVANGIKGGQLDVRFCSIACLRNWFCMIVDDLERQLLLAERSGHA